MWLSFPRVGNEGAAAAAAAEVAKGDAAAVAQDRQGGSRNKHPYITPVAEEAAAAAGARAGAAATRAAAMRAGESGVVQLQFDFPIESCAGTRASTCFLSRRRQLRYTEEQ